MDKQAILKKARKDPGYRKRVIASLKKQAGASLLDIFDTHQRKFEELVKWELRSLIESKTGYVVSGKNGDMIISYSGARYQNPVITFQRKKGREGIGKLWVLIDGKRETGFDLLEEDPRSAAENIFQFLTWTIKF